MTGKVFTAVFRDVTPEEAAKIGAHPKWTAGSWSHALDHRDAALDGLARLREENAQLAAFVVAVGGVWSADGARSKLTGELSLAETIKRDAAIAEKAAEAQPVARVTITKPGDSLTGISFMSLNEHGRATLGKGRHELYAHPPAEHPAILKGIGKINGDGWKDVTKEGEVVFVWNCELPAPYMPGQYPRIGNESWTASTNQYDFAPASADEVREILPKFKSADALYTMDQMRDYADAFHKSRVEARPECVDCGDSIMAHDPGTCGTCHAVKYANGAKA
jgi:ribosomal protein S27AE